MLAEQCETQGFRTIVSLAGDQLITFGPAEDDRARTAHIVLALDEMHIVLIAAKKRKERGRKVFRRLTNTVIIDEAHNLIPAINGAHSVSISVASLTKIVDLLDAYLSHFQSRLGAAKSTAVTSAKRLTERLQCFMASIKVCGWTASS